MTALQIRIRRWKQSLHKSQVIMPTRLTMLPLEDRAVPAGLDIRSIDGTGNNLDNPLWGSTGQQFLRVAEAQYANGISEIGGTTRPSAREISNLVSDQVAEPATNDRFLSAMVYAWGQFIDHDMDLTNTGTEKMSIPVPAGDPYFDPNSTGTKTINSTRSVFDPATGADASNPRQQINGLSAFLDGAMVYGSDAITAEKLRTLSGGKMKMTSDGYLPLNNSTNFPTGPVEMFGIGVVPADELFAAGEARANENPELTSLQTLFVREHNRLAEQIAKTNPKLTDEQIYQKARAIVIGELQAITYNEWLPSLLGPNAMPKYTGYKPTVDPTISNEFATAAFRFGHSLLGDDIEFLDNNGNEVRDAVALSDAFFNSKLVTDTGIDPILKYLATDHSSEVDTQVVNSVRNFLFGPPGAGGLDLASLNIQRGRDHGLADYNTTRAAYGLPKVTSFGQITSNVELLGKLQDLYGTVDNIDLWVGVLAEDHVPGGSVGPTNRAILVDQFTRLRDGDRFWYQNSFKGKERVQIEGTQLSDVVKRNTDLTVLQSNLFIFEGAQVSGSVFNDTNKNGKLDTGENTVVGTTVFADLNRNGKADKSEPFGVTDADGVYTLLSPVPGKIALVVQVPAGLKPTTGNPLFVTIGAGEDVSNANIGFTTAPTPPQTPGRLPPPPGTPSKPPVLIQPPPANGNKPAPTGRTGPTMAPPMPNSPTTPPVSTPTTPPPAPAGKSAPTPPQSPPQSPPPATPTAPKPAPTLTTPPQGPTGDLPSPPKKPKA